MGYFSNGTEGEVYVALHCAKCRHGDGHCPVWDAHLLFNGTSNSKARDMLDMLIPRSKDRTRNERCTMFLPAGGSDG